MDDHCIAPGSGPLTRPRHMGRFFQRFYSDEDAVYKCSGCQSHFAQYKDLLSTNFRGRTGNALLFNQVVNVTTGPLEDSVMTTGLHTIRCLYCVVCQERVGWKYEVAFEEDQKYKEGRFILEEELISTVSEGAGTSS